MAFPPNTAHEYQKFGKKKALQLKKVIGLYSHYQLSDQTQQKKREMLYKRNYTIKTNYSKILLATAITADSERSTIGESNLKTS